MTEWKQETDWVWSAAENEWFAIFCNPYGDVDMYIREEDWNGPPSECWRPLPAVVGIMLWDDADQMGYVTVSCTEKGRVSIAHAAGCPPNGSIKSLRILSLASARELRNWLTGTIARMEKQ